MSWDQKNEAEVEWTVAQVLSCSADAVSLTACIWLLCRFKRASGDSKQKLFPKLVYSLTLADILLHSVDLLFNVLYSTYDIFPMMWRPTICTAVSLVWYQTVMISVLQELLISLYCVSVSRRWVSAWPALKWAIPFAWFLGFVIGAPMGLGGNWKYSSDTNKCEYQASNFAFFGAVSFCVGVSFVAYACVVIRSSFHSPLNTHRLYLRRLVVFPLIFLISFSPGLIGEVWVASQQWAVWSAFQGVSWGLIGLLNVAAYSRWTSLGSAARVQGQGQATPFSVDFGTNDVVHVAYTQAEALEYATEQLADLPTPIDSPVSSSLFSGTGEPSPASSVQTCDADSASAIAPDENGPSQQHGCKFAPKDADKPSLLSNSSVTTACVSREVSLAFASEEDPNMVTTLSSEDAVDAGSFVY